MVFIITGAAESDRTTVSRLDAQITRKSTEMLPSRSPFIAARNSLIVKHLAGFKRLIDDYGWVYEKRRPTTV